MLVDNEFAEKYYAILDKLVPVSTIEIGAYDAEFSQHMATKIQGRNVWAFEALPSIHSAFKDRLRHIHYVNLAVADSEKIVVVGDLGMDKNQGIPSGASSILARIDPILGTTEVEVEATTVDSIVAKNYIRGPIALWIDCEGANKEVLSGAINTLKNVVSVYIEVEMKEVWEGGWLKAETVKFLNDNGFVLIHEKKVYGGIQQDLIFVREDLVPLLA